MKLDTESLQEAYNIVSNVPRSILESSQWVRMEFGDDGVVLTLSSGDTLARATATVTAAGKSPSSAVYVERKTLGAFLAGANKEVNLTVRPDGSSTFRSGSAKLSLASTVETTLGQYEEWKGRDTAKALKIDGAQARIIRQFVTMVGGSTSAVNERLLAVSVTRRGVLAANEVGALAMKTPKFFGKKQPARVLLPPLVAGLVESQYRLCVEDSGAGLVYAAGSVYQATAEEAVTNYPDDMLWDMVDRVIDAGVVMRVKRVALLGCLAYMTGYLSAAKSRDLEVDSDGKGVVVNLPLQGGQATQRLDAEVVTTVGLKSVWRIPDLKRFLQLFDDDVTIEYCRPEPHYQGFVVYVENGPSYVLISSVLDGDAAEAEEADVEEEETEEEPF